LPERRGDQFLDRRLAVRAADTNNGQIEFTPVSRGQFAERRARVAHREHGAFRQGGGDFFPFHNDRCNTFGCDFVQKIVAVEMPAFDGKKQVARFCLP